MLLEESCFTLRRPIKRKKPRAGRKLVWCAVAQNKANAGSPANGTNINGKTAANHIKQEAG
jgi:hypothetical protein